MAIRPAGTRYPIWRCAIALATIFTGGTVSRAADFIDEHAIRRDVVGGDFTGVYADGRPWQELYRSDGTLTYSENRRTIDGYWTIDGGVFCTLYWREISGGCWRVRAIGSNCFEFYASGQHATDPAILQPQQAWTARGWDKAKAPTCGAPQTS